MKIIERATMPDGTEIQLEDWSDKKYKTVSGFIWTDHFSISNSKEYGKIWMDSER